MLDAIIKRLTGRLKTAAPDKTAPDLGSMQRLGLDVVIERDSGNLVTLEVNGEMSGYRGLQKLGKNPDIKIIEQIGRTFYRGKILAHPYFIELSGDKDGIINHHLLKKRHGLTIVYTPLLLEQNKISLQELGKICGPLEGFDLLLGLSKYLYLAKDSEPKVYLPDDNERKEMVVSKMINQPGLEYLTGNKLAQYVLLKDIEGLNMPETVLIDRQFNAQQVLEMLDKYGCLITKPINGRCGIGVIVLEPEIYGRQLSQAIKDKLVQFQINYSRFMEQIKINVKENVLLSKRLASTERFPEKDRESLVKRLNQSGTLLQRKVETRPVISGETRQPHYARARLIWFNGYIGGYWALSAQPVNEASNGSSSSNYDPQQNCIVNYCNTHKAQDFTVQENARFKEYAELIVPQIINKTRFYTDSSAYDLLTERAFIKAITDQPDLF